MRRLILSPKIAVVLAIVVAAASADNPIKLYIGGIFPMSAEGGESLSS